MKCYRLCLQVGNTQYSRHWIKKHVFQFLTKITIQVLLNARLHILIAPFLCVTVSLCHCGIVSLRNYKSPRTFCAVWSHTFSLVVWLQMVLLCSALSCGLQFYYLDLRWTRGFSLRSARHRKVGLRSCA